jgi:hypothetical protein
VKATSFRWPYGAAETPIDERDVAAVASLNQSGRAVIGLAFSRLGSRSRRSVPCRVRRDRPREDCFRNRNIVERAVHSISERADGDQ